MLEYVAPEQIGFASGTTDVPALVQDCAELLVKSGVDPDRTRLVLTGDFVRSVQDRGEPESAYHQDYDLQRNTGIVAGKTIPRPDSTVDVLLHAAMFAPELIEDEADVRSIFHTLLHEAQHVAIEQHGEASGNFENEPWARRNLLVAAAQTIDEYRAEAPASTMAGPTGWAGSDIPASLRAWLEKLQATVEDYQDHLDVQKLSYEVMQETHNAWKLLAYVVAEEVGAGQQLAPSVLDSDLWVLMVEPHWTEFSQTLREVPLGNERTPRPTLDRHAEALSDIFDRWLRAIGFKFEDNAQGSTFHIVNWQLLLANLDE